MKNLIKLFPFAIVFVLGSIVALITSNIGFLNMRTNLIYLNCSIFLVCRNRSFITNRIDDALQRRRSQKDLILKKIEEVDTAIKGLNDLFHFENNKFQLPNTPFLSMVKNIGMWAKRYEESIATYYHDLENQGGYTKINTRELVKVCTKRMMKMKKIFLVK